MEVNEYTKFPCTVSCDVILNWGDLYLSNSEKGALKKNLKPDPASVILTLACPSIIVQREQLYI